MSILTEKKKSDDNAKEPMLWADVKGGRVWHSERVRIFIKQGMQRCVHANLWELKRTAGDTDTTGMGNYDVS